MNMSEQILIVEDEEAIARVLQLELEFEGYSVGVAYTGTDGLIRYREQEWDLVLLDLMLPGMNGLGCPPENPGSGGRHACYFIDRKKRGGR